MLGNIGNRVFLALGLSLAFFSFSMFGGIGAEFWCSSSGSARIDICDSCRSVFCLSDSSFLSPSLASASEVNTGEGWRNNVSDLSEDWIYQYGYELEVPTGGYNLYDGYNLPMPGDGDFDGYWTFTDTEGLFHNWEVTDEQGFRQTFYEYLRVILPSIPDFTAYMQTVQTDYIVGLYRLLYFEFESNNRGIAILTTYACLMNETMESLYAEVQGAGNDIEYIRSRFGRIYDNLDVPLSVLRDRLVTMDSRLATISTNSAYLYDIKNNVTSLKSAVDSCKSYLYTCVTKLGDMYDRLGTMSANMIAKFNTLHGDLDNVEALLQGVIDALEDLSIQVDVSTDFDGDFDGNVNVTNWPYTSSQFVNFYNSIIQIPGYLEEISELLDYLVSYVNQLRFHFVHTWDLNFIGNLDNLQLFNYASQLAPSLYNVFPFCLVYYGSVILGWLEVSNPSYLVPSITVPLPTGLTGSSNLVVSCSQLQPLLPAIRFTSYILLVLLLLFSTKKVMFTGRE